MQSDTILNKVSLHRILLPRILFKCNLLLQYFFFADIRLDWDTFIVDDNDNQLIDLDCFYGNPFPILDQDGREVVEDEQEEEGGNLVRVVLKEHEGRKSAQPFKVLNKQMVRSI